MGRRGFYIRISKDTIEPALECLSAFDAETAVIATANSLAKDAKVAAPRDSGGLANSVRVEVNGSRGRVGYVAEHAPHVEYGHRQNVGQFVPGLGDDGRGRRLVEPFVPGQHFFRPCVKRAREMFRRMIRESLEEAAR